jgi:ribosomal protein S18 acetylase RimI-like enzyme
MTVKTRSHPGKAASAAARRASDASSDEAIAIRPVRAADIAQVIAIDERITGLAKSAYWQEAYERYGKRRPRERFFLVATAADQKAGHILGFIIGEIRAWEFGSAPCGWVFALSVDPGARLHGLGQAMFAAISAEFRKAGVTKMRTMVARDNQLHSLFFRGEGMMAGPYIQLEKEL